MLFLSGDQTYRCIKADQVTSKLGVLGEPSVVETSDGVTALSPRAGGAWQTQHANVISVSAVSPRRPLAAHDSRCPYHSKSYTHAHTHARMCNDNEVYRTDTI